MSVYADKTGRNGFITVSDCPSLAAHIWSKYGIKIYGLTAIQPLLSILMFCSFSKMSRPNISQFMG